MKQVCQLRALDYGNRGAGRLAWTILLRPSRPIENRPQARSLPYNCRRQGDAYGYQRMLTNLYLVEGSR